MHKSNILEQISAFLLGIIITVAAGFFIFKSGVLPNLITLIQTIPSTEELIPKSAAKWKVPASTKQGYPYIDENSKLSIFDIETKKLKPTNIEALTGSGSLDLGETTPAPSPDLLYTAYIDKNTNELWLLSNESLETMRIPETQDITYITGWSPNGKTLIYYTQPRTVSTAKDGMNTDWSIVEKFARNAKSGFYALDITTGITTNIAPVDNIVAIFNESEILTRVHENKLVIFSIKNFTADYSTIKDNFGFGAGQFMFSQNSNQWVFIGSDKPTEDMYITKANFPNKVGTTVDAGSWGEVQWPVISPDGKTVVYERSEWSESLKTNIPALWLAQDGKIPEKIGMGRPLAWVDADNLIVQETMNVGGTAKSVTAFFNISTKKTSYFKVL